MDATADEAVQDILDCSSYAQDIEHIRQWIVQNRKYKSRQDDSFIWRFLRVCKYDVEKAKKLICSYYDCRHECRQMFTWPENDEDLYNIIAIQSAIYMIIHPELNAPNVIVIKLGVFDFRKYSLDSYRNAIAIVGETHLELPKINSQDIDVVIDLKEIGWSLISRLTPKFLWDSSRLQMNMPLGYKNVHIVNGNSHLKLFLRLMKYFMNKEFIDQIIVHDPGSESIYSSIPPQYFPNELGGTAGPEKCYAEATTKIIREGKQFYLENEIFGIDKVSKHKD